MAWNLVHFDFVLAELVILGKYHNFPVEDINQVVSWFGHAYVPRFYCCLLIDIDGDGWCGGCGGMEILRVDAIKLVFRCVLCNAKHW